MIETETTKLGAEMQKSFKKEMKKDASREDILRKLEKLMKLQMLLKDPKISVDDYDEEEIDALLSKAELIEEALKNYMYQFGLSLYQNKQGNLYFKKFVDDNDDTRGYDELDRHNFELREREPSLLEKLLEKEPEERIQMLSTIENVVFDLYERDSAMVEVFDNLISEEIQRCRNIIDSRAVAKLESQLNEVDNENVSLLEKEIPVAEAQTISIVEEIENQPSIEDMLQQETEVYQCGEDEDKELTLPKVDKIRRVYKDKPIVVTKDNINDR